ncbi:MAG: DUF1257 domain-containing protein [Bdellovibrionales bacterium]|nr:DUF1257 domain-containing protein [Bdellovibrionales bacterium]
MEALDELQYARKEIASLTRLDGKVEIVDFAFEDEKGNLIGVRQNKENELELIARDGCNQSAIETIDKVKQTYARLKILDEVQRKGYKQVKEEILPDGSIRLVVEKW